ncbi:MAG: hypothetical protein K6A63_01005 [Acholeplasmatales bacterium]|nr:hypothetical protein [Acholeplasmatales bacterium]
MKKLKLLNFGLAAAAVLSLAACGNTESSGSTTKSGSTTAASSAAAESSAANSSAANSSAAASSAAASSAAASSAAASSAANSSAVSSSDETTLMASTLYCVGDSTMCNYIKADGSHSDNLYYPRYGYATQLETVFNTEYLTINNLALSGRSSLDFLSESNYATLKSSIKSGDYLLIGFGHNDEKYTDSDRFTYPALDAYQTKYSTYGGSNVVNFQYNLYENYIKLAKDAGATPILATPIVRLKDDADYTGNAIHQVSGVGDYTACILDLAADTGTAVVDLTSLTKAEWTAKGSDAVYYHSMGGKYDVEDISTVTEANKATTPVVADPNSADHTHINVYGAKEVSYLFASNLPASCSLSKYVNSDIAAPTAENDLVSWPGYLPPLPTTDWYKGKRSNTTNFTITSQAATAYGDDTIAAYGWNSTAFGSLGTNSPTSKGWIANEGTDSYTVGQYYEKSGTPTAAGKITAGEEGVALLFQQIDLNYKFTMEADVTVATTVSASASGSGFGIGIYDGVTDFLNNKGFLPNVVAGGLLATSSSSLSTHWERIGGSSSGFAINSSAATISGYYSVGDTAHLKLVKDGQSVVISVTYNGTTTTAKFLDKAFTNTDSNYLYAGLFASRGTTITVAKNTLTFTIDGVEDVSA